MIDTESIRVAANAKINIALDILGKRADGYHEMDMVMQSVTLHDVITIGKSNRTSLRISNSALPVLGNLILKAHEALEKAAGRLLPCNFSLEKGIPVAAGLGGGSADAAAVLVGVNKLYALGFNEADLEAIGAQVGSDVPFCVKGGLQRARGRGTQLERIEAAPRASVVMIKPCEGLSTRVVFEDYRNHEKLHPDIDGVLELLKKGEFSSFRSCAGNALFPAASSMRPHMQEAIIELTAACADYAGMSGSGPCVFGLYATREGALHSYHILSGLYTDIFLCEFAPEGIQTAL